jgi:hypothetical protein
MRKFICLAEGSLGLAPVHQVIADVGGQYQMEDI